MNTDLTTKISNCKVDHRAPRGWWADGEYINQCRQCGAGFIGDKRAGHCADCAYAEPVSAGEPPAKIYLQWHGDADEPDNAVPYEKRGEISWCADKVFKHDVEYVRADLRSSAPSADQPQPLSPPASTGTTDPNT